MAILNLPTFTEQKVKTPEEKLLESLQQMQIERPQAEVPRFTRYGNRMAERGGFDVLPQEQLRGMTQQQVDEYEAERRKARGAGISETLMRVGQAFAGQDADAGIVRRQEARQAQAQQAEMQELQEGFFKDPKYKNMAKILGVEYAFEQRKADKQAEMQAQANKKFLDAVKGTVYEGLADIVGVDQARQTYAQTELSSKPVPADIQKLNQLATLREQLNPKSPSYNENYTEKQFQQDASILGVSSNLFSGSKTDFIKDYMKQMRTMKTSVGRPLYTDEKLRTMAESAYELIYPPITVEDEEVVDLGKL
jgi:hypothetical protein